jgi:6-phosphogluconolactonase (cycloisomerase 2 family)
MGMRRKLRLVRRIAPRRLLLGAATVAVLLAPASPAQAASYVYVTNPGVYPYDGEGSISQYRVGSGGKLVPLSPATIPAGSAPTDVAVSPDGRSVYVTNPGPVPRDAAGTVSQYDVGTDGRLTPKTPTGVPAGVGSGALAVSSDGKSLYVTNSADDTISQYDIGATGRLSPKTPATVDAVGGPRNVAINPNGTGVYVGATPPGSPAAGGNLYQYDVDARGRLSPKSPALSDRLQYPLSLALRPNGKNLYESANYEHGGTYVIQYVIDAEGRLAPGPQTDFVYHTNARDLAVSPNGRSVYVGAPQWDDAPQTPGDLLQYDIGANGRLSPKNPFAAGNDPNADAVAVGADSRSVYVVESGYNTVSQYDADAQGQLFPKSPTTVPAGDSPSAIAVSPDTASVRVSGKTLVFTAPAGVRDNVAITQPSSSTLRITDRPSFPYTGAPIRAGTGCTRRGPYTADCHGDIARVRVAAGDRADKIANSTGVRSSLQGEGGGDVLLGGSQEDILLGGPSPDVIKGMNGSDQLFARDLTSDTTINCDGGIGTPGPADSADLDQLPKDPNSVISGCEAQHRH